MSNARIKNIPGFWHHRTGFDIIQGLYFPLHHCTATWFMNFNARKVDDFAAKRRPFRPPSLGRLRRGVRGGCRPGPDPSDPWGVSTPDKKGVLGTGLHHAACTSPAPVPESKRSWTGRGFGIWRLRPARQLRRSRPRTAALHIKMGEGDDQEDVLHTFFQFDDGSCIAFFDAPDRPFDWKEHLVSFYKTLFYSLFIHLQGLLSSSSITFGCFFFSLFSAHFSVACGPYCRLTAGSSHCF